MQVRGGSKMRNLLDYAMKEFGEKKALVWSGYGPSVGKAISCAEIVKRQYRNVHQFNKICYVRCEEHWDPKMEGLDPLVVNRHTPMVHILLSHEPINDNLPG
ncbi:hypothetical protein AAG570_009810 [Ranatra chinensis]|uniref:DNA/RNA-binding protein Alba-like domain-containing protein n=1 Tax=Ranatra chinensis TaxID=642074 RepID=A0ABD0Z795_9HEMI